MTTEIVQIGDEKVEIRCLDEDTGQLNQATVIGLTEAEVEERIDEFIEIHNLLTFD